MGLFLDLPEQRSGAASGTKVLAMLGQPSRGCSNWVLLMSRFCRLGLVRGKPVPVSVAPPPQLSSSRPQDRAAPAGSRVVKDIPRTVQGLLQLAKRGHFGGSSQLQRPVLGCLRLELELGLGQGQGSVLMFRVRGQGCVCVCVLECSKSHRSAPVPENLHRPAGGSHKQVRQPPVPQGAARGPLKVPQEDKS